jgi:hypothetical protein
VTGQYPLYAQAAAPERLPSFEVASVKENKTDPGRTQALVQPGGRFVATNAPLKLLIADAFLGAQRAKGPVEVVVIDSVERPTPD